MKIAIIAIGTRGDIQPCVALAKELKKMGTDVFIATFKEYKILVESNNIDYKEMPNNPANRSMENNGNKSALKLETYLKIWLKKSLELCLDSDALIYTPPFVVGAHLAEKLKIPFFPVIFEPSIKTKEFPSPHQPILYDRNRMFNKFSYYFTDFLFWNRMKKRINQLRTGILNLPPLKVNPYNEMIEKKIPFLACYSANLIPKPKDWYDDIQVNGYWYLDAKEEQESVIKKLEDYLGKGNKPIFIDFGSFSNKAIQKQLLYIIEDLKNSNERFIIDLGKLTSEDLQLPANSFLLNNNVSHKWLLPKVKAIIMHGGVGVTHAALKAGIPSIPIAIIGTQYFWGEKLFKLGLGTKPIRIRKLKQGDLLQAITYLNKNKEIFTNVFQFKEKIKNEKGSEGTAEFIISYMKNYLS